MKQAERLSLDGELSIYRALECRQLVLDALATAGDAALDIDLSGVEEIDTAGVQLLMLARREAAARGVALQLCAPSAAVSSAFACLGLDPQLECVLDGETA